MDAVIIGAGWAGLGVSYELSQRGIRHRVFERARIGETWRTQRWDSFRLNTPAADTLMPGDRYAGSEPDGAMTHFEFIALLEDYARRHRLPVEEGRAVTTLVADDDGRFVVEVGGETVRAANVVIATGSLCRPLPRPAWATGLTVPQIDACDYRNAAALPAGRVLVVGSGQTGVQIAYDLNGAGRIVYLATGRVGRFVRRYRGREMLRWMGDSGLMDVRREELIAAAPNGRLLGRAVVGANRTLSLQLLSAEGVVLTGRLIGFADGRLIFADDLGEHMRFADEASADVKRIVDAYIECAGIAAIPAEDDPAEVITPPLSDPPVLALDASGLGCIIWCTGCSGDYGYLKVEGALDAQGSPVQNDGVGAVPGLYFVGLDFSVNRKSGTILAIDEESTHLAALIADRCRSA